MQFSPSEKTAHHGALTWGMPDPPGVRGAHPQLVVEFCRVHFQTHCSGKSGESLDRRSTASSYSDDRAARYVDAAPVPPLRHRRARTSEQPSLLYLAPTE
jgi:hypothetical protein